MIRISETFATGVWIGNPTGKSKNFWGDHNDPGGGRWRLACPENDLDLIFPNNARNHINNKNMLRRHFRPALQAADCPSIRFHDLRHTNASLHLENRENIKYIQAQLGHATPTITLNVYAHLMKDRNPEAAQRLGNAVFGESGSKMVAEIQKGLRP